MRPFMKTWSMIIFTDGTSVTAEDVKFTFDLYKKFALQSPRLYDVRYLRTVEIINNRTVQLNFLQSPPSFRETIGQLPILSKKNYQTWMNYNFISNLQEIKPVIGNGFFRLRQVQPNSVIHLDVNPNHYPIRAKLDGIDIVFYSTYENLVNAFIKEEVDYIEVQDETVRQKISQIIDVQEFQIINNKNIKLFYISLNTTKAPFNDLRIRKAIHYAINKDMLVKRNLENRGSVALNILDLNSPYFFRSAKPYAYNPMESLNILKEVGFSSRDNGKLFYNDRELKFEFYFNQGSIFEESIARSISIYLGELGINIIPQPLAPVELDQRVNKGDYQAALMQFVYDPLNPERAVREFYLNKLRRNNEFGGFNNKEINQLIKFGEEALNQTDLRPIISQIQHLFNVFSPCIFLFFEDKVIYAINNRFENTRIPIREGSNDITRKMPIYEWYVPKEKQKY